MARVKDNILTQGLSGAVNKQLVFKTRNGKTFISKYPNRSKVIPSEKQLVEKVNFRNAVSYAKGILANPILKAEVQQRTPPGKLVYHQAIKEYYATQKADK
jgi:hypothetical protein